MRMLSSFCFIMLALTAANIFAADLPIKQFQAGDVISAEDVNGNFQALNAAMQQMQTLFAALEKRNTILENKNQTLETEVVSLKTKIAALERQIAEKPVNTQPQSVAKTPAGCLKNKYAVRLSIYQNDKNASVDVPTGERITILKTQGEWYHITTDNHKTGWIRKDKIRLEECK